MWKRKELKSKARKVIKKNYWTAIVVCFILAIVTGEFGTSILGWIQKEEPLDLTYIVDQTSIEAVPNINKDKVEDIKQKASEFKEKFSEIKEKYMPRISPELESKIIGTVRANINSATKSQKYIYKIWDAVTSFNINEIRQGIILSVTALFALLFTIVIGDPLIVAGRKYFLEIREGKNRKITDIAKEIFKGENWVNIATVMFLRNLYNFLWYLTIVGGVIKMYEYRMIPYILAQTPQMERKEIFRLSKEMMEHNKWKAFVLDLSFLGWSIASLLTLGLVNIMYANSYKAATSTELYVVLKNNIENKK